MLTAGDCAPWFEGDSSLHPKASFATLGGRYVLLSFFGSASQPSSRQMLADLAQNMNHFLQRGAFFCGVSIAPEDPRQLAAPPKGVIYFWDTDRAISRLYGAITEGSSAYLQHTLILDPGLRVVAVLGQGDNGCDHVAQILKVLDQLPPLGLISRFAPVLAIPQVFEPQLCRTLIDTYHRCAPAEGGMLAEKQGQAVRVHDHNFKRRTDATVTDPSLISLIQTRLRQRLFPEIRKAFQFHVTQIERYLVGCYDATTGGHFRPHRDDTTPGSAHRRFAISINLNTEEFEGGLLRLPEFGVTTYRAPTGGAVVFSCSLMHEVLPVTRGRRFAFLPFVFDDPAARIRQANQQAQIREESSGLAPDAAPIV
jgi:predicted 2-oxoglutarate/Fe(II)-dependent dioxygenase YbiX/peroxiredoxin